jgi:site-specific DNA recombinase
MRGAETKLVLPGLAPQKHGPRCDPALIKAIARGRAWFDELVVSGRARSLQELAKRDGISRRYIRRLVGLAFLSPQLVEAILQGRQPVALTATRLAELDLPLDWTEQHKGSPGKRSAPEGAGPSGRISGRRARRVVIPSRSDTFTRK